jgi:hypothetical protein
MKPFAILALLFVATLVALGCGPSLAAMHALAEHAEVQRGAPLHAMQRVTIQAPRARVWDILSAFAAWPSWQPNVTRVDAPTTLAAGAAFTWVNGTSEIHSRLALVRPNEQLAWSGSVSLAKAIHVWRLEAPTADTTVVEVEETLDGFLLTWFYSQQELDAEVARSLANLRHAAETKIEKT